MDQYPIDFPKERWTRQRLISYIAHRCPNFGIVPNRPEELFSPTTINLHIVIYEQQVLVARAPDTEVALLSTISFLMMEVSDVKSCINPACIFREFPCRCVVSAMDHDHFCDGNGLF